MKTIGNVLWLVLCGFWTALGWLVLAAILAVTVIGLPFARQCLKLAQFTLWPFGRTAVPSANARSLGGVGAVIWFIPGLFVAIGYAIGGVLLCVTVIGIPFGLQAFKFVPLALFPFGKEIVKNTELKTRMHQAAAATQQEQDPAPSPAMATPVPSAPALEAAPTQAAAQPADWYPDPNGEKRLRYFDGANWTEHTAD
ncbi:MAG: YccF domain-containing protein [Acidimicrobiales bacterium]